MTQSPRIGRCIYCGERDGPLTREHVVPFGLGGSKTLLDASCPKCQATTQAIEDTCLRTFFGEARIAMAYPSRRKKQRPQTLSARRLPSGESVEIPVDEWPLIVGLPRMPTAGALRMAKADNPALDVLPDGFWVHRPTDERLLATMRKFDVHELSSGAIETTKFARFLAKVAHSVAVHDFGLDGFDPFLTDYIITGRGGVNYWVGGRRQDDPPVPTTCDIHPMVSSVGTILVYIRLFAHLGAPTYHVVTGHRRPGPLPKNYVHAPPKAGL